MSIENKRKNFVHANTNLWNVLELSGLLGHFLRLLQSVDDGVFLLLLGAVALFVLHSVLDDSLDDIFGGDFISRVDHHELFHCFWNAIRIAELTWDVCLTVAYDVDVEVLHQFF